ncbi:hypothetical protein MVEN_01405300 [Mycena venus]|uniref:Uncharacterized protein n=1 Tax=Mycena venus TaxID=2733690 RepID=A0A8H7CUM8_9AGAR|nr:hypothetical protein MVEN_01405300 [Mycena venus]
MAYYNALNDPEANTPNNSRRLRVFCIVSTILNLWCIWLAITQWHLHEGMNVPHVYSPAEHVITNKFVKFTRGFAHDIPIYERPPSAIVDAAWFDLWSVAQIKIPKSAAMKMPNHTWPLLNDRESYMISLDVFHQLHCLDTLRKQLYPRYSETHVSDMHIRHCIGAIRQALMCAADVSPVVWQWSERLQIAEQRDDIVHVCRDYDRIRDWASERTFEYEENDFGIYIEDDLPVSPI